MDQTHIINILQHAGYWEQKTSEKTRRQLIIFAICTSLKLNDSKNGPVINVQQVMNIANKLNVSKQTLRELLRINTYMGPLVLEPVANQTDLVLPLNLLQPIHISTTGMQYATIYQILLLHPEIPIIPIISIQSIAKIIKTNGFQIMNEGPKKSNKQHVFPNLAIKSTIRQLSVNTLLVVKDPPKPKYPPIFANKGYPLFLIQNEIYNVRMGGSGFPMPISKTHLRVPCFIKFKIKQSFENIATKQLRTTNAFKFLIKQYKANKAYNQSLSLIQQIVNQQIICMFNTSGDINTNSAYYLHKNNGIPRGFQESNILLHVWVMDKIQKFLLLFQETDNIFIYVFGDVIVITSQIQEIDDLYEAVYKVFGRKNITQTVVNSFTFVSDVHIHHTG